MKGNAFYFILCSGIVLIHGAKLLPHSHIPAEREEAKERNFPTSPTISVQKAFFNFVKFAENASNSQKNKEEVTVFDADEKDGHHFSDHDEDDAEGSSTTLPSTPSTSTMTVDAVVVSATDDATQAPSGSHSPSDTGSPSAPSDSADGGSLPGSPAESDPTPNPGDAVPGQPGDGADAPSSSSSSESSSSSSEEDLFRGGWGKAWQYKIQNELILRAGKTKDVRRVYSPLVETHRKFADN